MAIRAYLFLLIFCCTLANGAPLAGGNIVESARKKIGITVLYDPTYTKLNYPDGDVSNDRGVCTDVIIRALRDARKMDLQRLVHEDMTSHFSVYPHQWGLSKPDKNIDHRRVPNLQTFFKRHAESLNVVKTPGAFKSGDIVTSLLPGNLPHVMIVSDNMSEKGVPYVIHNIGAGTREENALFTYPLTGHYRLISSSRLTGAQTE